MLNEIKDTGVGMVRRYSGSVSLATLAGDMIGWVKRGGKIRKMATVRI